MGGGKTVTTLTALDNLSLVEEVYPALVLAPLRVARSTWPNEIAKWDHLSHLRVSTVVGSARERAAALRKDADIYTTNYDNLVWLVDHLGADWPFKTVIADELTRLKSFRIRQGSKRAGALGKVAHTKVTRFIGLTGTPRPNGLQDLWGQIWFMDQGKRLGRSFSSFLDRWFRPDRSGYGYEALPHAEGEITELLRDVCLTVEGLQVDEPIVNVIDVELPAAAMKQYRAMEKDLFTEIGEYGIEAPTVAAKMNKCRQLAQGAAYIDDESNWEENHRAKIEALESVIEEANGMPVLVAYHFKSDLARLRKAFPKARVLDANPKTIDEWNAGKIPILLAHPQSAGHGLNLADGGNILAFFALDWSLEGFMQIIERIGPMRQKQAGYDRPMFIHLILAAGTIDDLLHERLKGKRTMQDVLLAAMKERKHD